MNKLKKSVRSGFTLIELIAVMVILGILAAVIVPAIGSLTAGAYQSNAQTMYGAIKNSVNNQSVKNSMTGSRMKQFPVISSSTLNTYLDSWIEDYDKDYWVQWQFDNHVGNAVATDNAAAAAVFGYFPHGIPNSVSNAGSAVDISSYGDAANTSQEDVYYIVYAPITTLDGADGGVQFDGYTLCLFYDDDQDHNYEGDITVAANGTVTYVTDPDTQPSSEFVHTSIKAAD
ncbi:MAG: hypothetical protein CMG74_02355 [Candidatus Marinimicrobia bacterium]|nr:hypothetical protein [Candidatus Neomarinimicrobiota bacterium]